MAEAEAERFWSKVDKTDTCWLWTASTRKAGYGQFRLGKKLVSAHRYAYELLVGPIPDGLMIDHLCRVRLCVNPTHLEPVTNHENVRRGEAGANSARKTHCPQGHTYDEVNTYMDKKNRRYCRECHRTLVSFRRKEVNRMELDNLGLSMVDSGTDTHTEGGCSDARAPTFT